MSKPDAPAPPDYPAAAREQGEANINTAIASGAINSPDQSNPFGSTSWSNPEYEAALKAWNAQNPGAPGAGGGAGTPEVGPSTGDYSVQNALLGSGGENWYDTMPDDYLHSQIGQNLGLPTPGHVLGKGDSSSGGTPPPPSPYDVWQSRKPKISDYASPGKFKLTSSLSPAVQKLFDQAAGGVDFSGLSPLEGGTEAERRRIEDATYRRSTRFLDPQREGYESTLADRGVMPGQEQYNTSLGKFDEQYGDARDRAVLTGGSEMERLFRQSLSGREQGLKELLTGRALPLDEMARIKALMPSGGVNGQNITPPPLLDAINSQYGANMDQYGLDSQQYGSQMGAGAGVMAAIIAAMAACSPDLKHKIEPIEGSVLEKLQKVPIRRFEYKPELGISGVFMGPMAPEWAKEFGGDGMKIELISMLGVMMKGLQELHQEVKGLRVQLEAARGKH